MFDHRSLPAVPRAPWLRAMALLAAWGCAGAALAGFEEGVSAYEARDYAKALEEFQAAAIDGDARAQFNIGNMHRLGQGTAKDVAMAARWYEAAAERGHAGAQNALGSMYAMGLGVPRDDARAYAWFTASAMLGNEMAEKNLARAKELISRGNRRFGDELVKQFKALYVMPFLGASGAPSSD